MSQQRFGSQNIQKLKCSVEGPSLAVVAKTSPAGKNILEIQRYLEIFRLIFIIWFLKAVEMYSKYVVREWVKT